MKPLTPEEMMKKMWSTVVVGDRMERSLDDFVNACEVAILDEQGKVAPQNHLIALLCDAVRLAREYDNSTRRQNGNLSPHTPHKFECVIVDDMYKRCVHCDRVEADPLHN